MASNNKVLTIDITNESITIVEVTGTASATIAKDTEEVQVKIKVTAQDGTTQEYTLIVTNQSDDCKLAILKVDGETLETDADGKYHITKKYLTSSDVISFLMHPHNRQLISTMNQIRFFINIVLSIQSHFPYLLC